MNLIESHRVEHKQSLTDTFEKEVVAFLNYHEGGIIYIGVDKDGKIVGCQNPDETQLKIKDKLKHNISPSCLGLFEVILETIEEQSIIKIIIASGRETPYYIKKNGMSEKGCYIRVGSSSEPMNQTMIEDLFAKRVRNSLGNIKSRRQDLTFEQLKIYYEEKGLKLNEKFASNLELLTDDGYYNYVAYLMADSNGVSIKVAKYAGTNKVDLIENNEYGYCSLIKATKRVLEKLEIENKTAALITSTTRKEQPLWNKVALREAVINAIVHNDYTTENPPVFEIFSDRIEITSTGGLSIIKNIDDFFSGYSNPTSRELMRIYKDLELVEHLGSGLNRILEAYDKDSFVIKQNYMKNIFYKNETPLNGVVSGGVNGVVSGGVTELLEFIQTNPGLRANELSKHIDTPLRTVQRWLKQLKDENKIEFQGAPKTGGYVLKDMKS
ncbi:MAG: transcriptional regulator [Erysipelotrichia bacterium]|nr:transcriptional regulator [Erysipelotrichia bacterium]